MITNSKVLEQYYDSKRLRGLIRSGWTLIRSRYVRSREEVDSRQIYPRDVFNQLTYLLLVVVPAIGLDAFQRIRSRITREPRAFKEGSWQWALQFSLREDLAHHTVETTGYHLERPREATEIDDLTAWVMTIMQFVWSYEEVMGVVWDEWTMVRLMSDIAKEANLDDHPLFQRLPRQWELARPYNAPLNGTYADVRRETFRAFIDERVNALPPQFRNKLQKQYNEMAARQRSAYQQQMSLLYRIVSQGSYDDKARIPLWDAAIGVIVGGEYFLIDLAVRDGQGRALVFGAGGEHWPLTIHDGQPYSPDGRLLELRGDQLYYLDDGSRAGALDMNPAAFVKWKAQNILAQRNEGLIAHRHEVDILLAETPRRMQKHLRDLLPNGTRQAIQQMTQAPVFINWDEQSGDLTLAEIRRSQRGIGDHALTVIRTNKSFIFDQHHVFFDGTWSLAMAEVLTNSAVQWSKRCVTIAPSEAAPIRSLDIVASPRFLKEARAHQQIAEISAETTIFDITVLFNLRKLLGAKGASLTVNDLLVTTRIFHAAHYTPSPAVQAEIDALKINARSPAERAAAKAVEESLDQGRRLNPALGIPIDASSFAPQERIYLLTFRNLSQKLVWAWDDTWEAYQAYRRIEPPNTPEGRAAFERFTRRRAFLVDNLQNFSYLLAASKDVALRGDSFSVNVFELLVHLPPWMQNLLRVIPEQFAVLNEIIRGDEVYSNIGRVAQGSSLSRFITAKDDGKAKTIVWGILTNDKGQMVVTMRDFRPHVSPLIRAGRVELARRLADDYVRKYTADLIGLVARMTAMLQAEPPARN